jgi:hypothetical protein
VPTETADSERPQEAFPFMQLPPELRVMVYKFALQDLVDPILSSDSGDAKRPEPFRGALAFLHKSRNIRLESCSDMMRIVRTHSTSLLHALQALAGSDIPGQFDNTELQYSCIRTMSEALRRVYSSGFEIILVRQGICGWDIPFPLCPSGWFIRKQ